MTNEYPLRYVDPADGEVYTAIDERVGTNYGLTALNVRNYGAVGDGIADDTAAIQVAIQALHPERGGRVFLPPGKYMITSTIVIDRPVLLEGSGMGDHLAAGDHGSISSSEGLWDILQQGSAIFTNSATLHALHVTSPGCTLRDFQVVNNRYPTLPTAGSGIRVEFGNSFRMQRVLVRGFYDCVAFEQSEYATIESCSFQDAVRHGIWARNLYHVDQGDMSVVGSVFGFSGWRGTTNATGSAIRLESGGGLRFVSSKINCGPPGAQAGWQKGVDVEITSGLTGVLLVTGSSIENVGTAISIQGAMVNCSITGNQHSGINRGVYVDGPDYVTITGNVYGQVNNIGVEIHNVDRGVISGNIGGTVIVGSTCSNITRLEAPLTGTVAPASTPSFVGQTYIDTTAGKVYVATATSSSAGWKILN